MSKKTRGQYYTSNSSYILDGFSIPSSVMKIVEPFAGKGDLTEWIRHSGYTGLIEQYDIDPKKEDILQRDTLLNPPDYNNAWVITNPPYLARNKSDSKDIYNIYNTNDLYKCFMHSLLNSGCLGGIIIIPAGFFLSPRLIDSTIRDAFLSEYKLTSVKYFEETVFSDTTTTVVALLFNKSDVKLSTQTVEWIHRPSGEKKLFTLTKDYSWIIGGDIYNLSVNSAIKVRRYVVGQPLKEGEQQTHITLNALDSGSKEGRISLNYSAGVVYQAKECSRTFATLRILGKTLSAEEQKDLCTRFNTLLETKRKSTWSLFLPQYRESKEYARKRIPFELAYTIVEHLLSS